MTTEQELIKLMADITTRQFKESSQVMRDALDDSNIATEEYPEVKCICRLMMSIAVQQKEERDFIFAQLAKQNKVAVETKTT